MNLIEDPYRQAFTYLINIKVSLKSIHLINRLTKTAEIRKLRKNRFFLKINSKTFIIYFSKNKEVWPMGNGLVCFGVT